MLKAIKELLVGTREAPGKPSTQPLLSAGPAGYFMPASVESLLNTASRKQCLQQLWENSALPKDLYEQFYLQPLNHLISLMQALPASQQGEYAREGGLADVTLQTTTFAVRLAKGHMLPPGAAPEDQSAQNVLWNAVVFYAALIQYLPLLNQIEGELQSGRVWLPGLTVPDEPYRFRFKVIPAEPALTTSQSAMIAGRLVPMGAITWLSTLPAAAQALMLIASRQPGSLPVIDDIVREAVRLARGEGLTTAAPSVAVANVAPVPVDVGLHTAVASVPAGESPVAENILAPGIAELGDDSAEPSGDVLLSSALDTPVNDKPLAEMVVAPEPVVEVEDDMQALFSLMNVSVTAPANPVTPKAGNAPPDGARPPESDPVPVPMTYAVVEERTELPDQRKEPEVAQYPTEVTKVSLVRHEPEQTQAGERPAEMQMTALAADDSSGEVFWQWLGSGFKEGHITVNQLGSRAHMISGFVFLCVPEIFHLYIKARGKEGTDRNDIQKAFEKLARHRVRKGQRFFIGHLYQEPAGVGSYHRINGYLVKANSLYGGVNVPEDSQLLVIP